MQRLLVSTGLLLACCASQATTVIRCEDPHGRVIFTQHGCAPSQQQTLHPAHNPPPSGSTEPRRMSERLPPEQRSTQPADSRNRGLTQPGNGCGNPLDAQERRKAIVSGRVRSGMSQTDVESALGRPQRISRQNGLTRYHYRDSDGNAQLVSFDENGCVRSKP